MVQTVIDVVYNKHVTNSANLERIYPCARDASFSVEFNVNETLILGSQRHWSCWCKKYVYKLDSNHSWVL